MRTGKGRRTFQAREQLVLGRFRAGRKPTPGEWERCSVPGRVGMMTDEICEQAQGSHKGL